MVVISLRITVDIDRTRFPSTNILFRFSVAYSTYFQVGRAADIFEYRPDAVVLREPARLRHERVHEVLQELAFLLDPRGRPFRKSVYFSFLTVTRTMSS